MVWEKAGIPPRSGTAATATSKPLVNHLDIKQPPNSKNVVGVLRML
jgi:hypothetical protein